MYILVLKNTYDMYYNMNVAYAYMYLCGGWVGMEYICRFADLPVIDPI
jgi:hypothetical protein